jgi:hypothetical protein
MSSSAGQAWFRLGTFLVLTALVILPFQRRDSAEFVVTVLALVIGLLMLAVVALIVKLSNR